MRAVYLMRQRVLGWMLSKEVREDSEGLVVQMRMDVAFVKSDQLR